MTAPEDLEMDFDRDALMGVFLAEGEERLSQMEGGLVLLEDHPSDEELLQAIFRAAHTLKGNSATLGFGALTEFTHVLEDLLERVRSRTLPVTGDLVSLLLASVDILRQLLSDAAKGLDGMSPSQRSFLGRLSSALGTATEKAAPPEGSRADRAPGEGLAESGAEKSVEIPGLNLMTRTLRVDLDRLDQMLALVGEIAVSRGRLRQLLEQRRTADLGEALEVHEETDRLDMDLQELVMKIRMIPVGPTFHHFARTIRDLARNLKKQVRLVTEGEDVEVDMTVIERIRDPLTHMIRNAVDHGIEAPEVRASLGKDPCGCIRLRAFHDTGSIVIQIVDDGSGLDRTCLLERARAMGLVGSTEELGDVALDQLIFEPGVSTSGVVTELSGRGVGLDVVRREVEALRGSIEVETETGRGTTITLRLPLTIAIIDGFVVKASEESYVIPVEAVIECIDLPGGRARDRPFGPDQSPRISASLSSPARAVRVAGRNRAARERRGGPERGRSGGLRRRRPSRRESGRDQAARPALPRASRGCGVGDPGGRASRLDPRRAQAGENRAQPGGVPVFHRADRDRTRGRSAGCLPRRRES